MINIETYINGFSELVNQPGKAPWEITQHLNQLITSQIPLLGDDYIIDNDIAIHKTATIETNVTLKPPVIIGANCFIGANSYLRNGVYLEGLLNPLYINAFKHLSTRLTMIVHLARFKFPFGREFNSLMMQIYII